MEKQNSVSPNPKWLLLLSVIGFIFVFVFSYSGYNPENESVDWIWLIVLTSISGIVLAAYFAFRKKGK